MSRIITKTYTCHRESDNNLDETLFHNANGYIGIRGATEEGVPAKWNTMRGSYINGFYDVIPMKQAENLCNFVDKKDTMLNVADTMTVTLTVDGKDFDPTKGKLSEHTRVLNMDEGYTLRRVLWTSKNNKQIEIESKRMTSFEELSYFSIEYTVKAVNDDVDIDITSSHIAGVTNYCNPNDPRLAQESLKNLTVLDMGTSGEELQDGAEYSYEVSETSVSKLRMCSVVCNEIMYAVQENTDKEDTVKKDTVRKDTKISAERVDETFSLKLRKGESVTLIKHCIYTDSLRYEDVLAKAVECLKRVRANGLDYYYDKQKEFLSDFWNKSGMEIYGDEATDRAVSFNLYQLLQSAAKDPYCSIAAKGLSGEGYEGHYFWDTEIFVLPFLIYTNPLLARMILNYRYRTLDKARKNAGLLGHKKGALYPWRTITGSECSGYFVSGSAAYHINADIAYAIISYYLATEDLDFVKNTGEEMLIETARLWMDLGNYNPEGQFVLNDVTGPDEYTCMVNNNYYTNCAAKYNILWAVKLFELLENKGLGTELKEKLNITAEELDAMSTAASKILLPYDEKTGINPQDDSFLSKPIWDFENTPKDNYPLLLHYHPLHLYRYQVCKQADTVLSYFMFEEMQDYDVMCKSYEYYEKITTHDSSLSTCAFSIVASRLGMQGKGYEYFGDSTKLDLENTHNNTKDGIHTANMGGCYMAVVNGFAGLRITEKGLFLAPFVPQDWDGYMFTMMYKGRSIRFTVNKYVVTAELLEGEMVEINIYDDKYILVEKEPIVAGLVREMAATQYEKG